MVERNCVFCDVRFVPTGNRQIYCGKACNAKATYRRRRAASPPAIWSSFVCPQCGNFVPAKAKTGPQSKYCSSLCGSKASYERRKDQLNTERRAESAARLSQVVKVCAECGELFTPEKSIRRMYCSKQCGKRACNRRQHGKRPTCCEDSCENRSVSGGLCRQHHPNAATWSRGSKETRRANLRRKTQLRRAKVSDPEAESFDREEIAERDGWRCGLCQRRVGKSYVWPDPRSASIDHIEPLSVGGKHRRENVILAHLGCNQSKGNRGGGEQLLLIG